MGDFPSTSRAQTALQTPESPAPPQTAAGGWARGPKLPDAPLGGTAHRAPSWDAGCRFRNEDAAQRPEVAYQLGVLP